MTAPARRRTAAHRRTTRRCALPGAALRARLAGVREDDGSGLIEFVVLCAVLLIPAMYLVLTLGSVQSAVFAVDALSRDAARIHATEEPGSAAQRVERLTDFTREDFGLASPLTVNVHCSADPCASPGGTVEAVVSVPVPIPGFGPLGGPEGPVEVSARHVVQVDQYWDGQDR